MIGTTRSAGSEAIAAVFANWSAASTTTARIAMTMPAAAVRRGALCRKDEAQRPIAETGVDDDDELDASRSFSFVSK